MFTMFKKPFVPIEPFKSQFKPEKNTWRRQVLKVNEIKHAASFWLADLGISREWIPPFTSTRYLPEDVSSVTSSLYLKAPQREFSTTRESSQLTRVWDNDTIYWFTDHLTMGKGKPSTVQKSLTEAFSYTVWDLSLARKWGPLTIGPSYTYFSVAFVFTCRREEGKKLHSEGNLKITFAPAFT